MRATPPDRTGSTVVVTGGTGGLGYFTAERLASTGAHVVITARDGERGRRAAASIARHVPGASVDVVALDLTDPDSVAAAADVLTALDRIDALVLNAGSTQPPRERTLTADGIEVTMAANVVGHAALVGHLWPTLTADRTSTGPTTPPATPPVRIVGLGSLATRIVGFDVAALVADHAYHPFATYARTKHVVHAFISELARRDCGAGVQALLAHPGYAVDALSPARPGIVVPGRFERLPIAQGKHDGARPTLRAVLDPSLPDGAMVGPRWTTRGAPVLTTPVASSTTPEAGAAVWDLLSGWTRGALPRTLPVPTR
ncbi:SDR family NAD(P)-dependent oxidoreductase [Litorihabitans aurantiacus]|uniref:Short-chain dehydrogenase n=1 Tax=Litorihabitans aurantiacus TaxID=1930061 RepID=A0AA38CTP1_9MICO|nr:SDR family NAD(P)-dependent oxidoreductase [Litorihabitans aurantiacus]GMA32951.1 short-chain dehydrogenase [Litorihabitans aurantiacus]